MQNGLIFDVKFDRIALLSLWPLGQEVKTPPSHGGIRGSIPLEATTGYLDKPSKSWNN